MKIQLTHTFEEIISLENLLAAWEEFVHGKRERQDVQVFGRYLMDNIIALHNDLSKKRYQHGGYYSFRISDPKPRHIHKASVRDRLLHHAIYRILYPFFDRTFLPDSFSCRLNKGTYKALDRFRTIASTVSQNHTKTCWVLKCDIRKFFAHIDHAVLLRIMQEYIPNHDICWILEQVVKSFFSMGAPRVGLPLGNLTSQLFANVYMNQFDQWVKHVLHAQGYVRYADDFVIFSYDRQTLLDAIPKITTFLEEPLHLSLHPKKVSIQTAASGIDFLGWVHFPDHRTLRTTTRRRMFRRIQEHPTYETLQSYRGLLQHGNAQKSAVTVRETGWLFCDLI